jgi:hypothetical protein
MDLCENLVISISNDKPSIIEAVVVPAICTFLHVSITMLLLENVMTGLAYTIELVPNVMTGLAYTIELVPLLCHYIKRCHLSQRWSSMEALDASSWLSPLSVFCQSRVVETVPEHHVRRQSLEKHLMRAIQATTLLR